MASFAKIGINNIVEQVISVSNNELLDNGIESETKGIEFCKFLFGQDTNWKQTSYNTIRGIHRLGGNPFRKNYAGIGHTYDENINAFIPIKLYNSWTLNETTCTWEAPIPYPVTNTQNRFNESGNPINDSYTWNEETKNWDLIVFELIL
jgi:hypothetical protein